MAQNRLIIPKTRCELCKSDYNFYFNFKWVLDLSFSRNKALWFRRQILENLGALLLLSIGMCVLNFDQLAALNGLFDQGA
mmetsp:Transcript_108315/g.233384  ORF Transcript_108315/g.233384 Transcript_108315/m.233384 type:complete len:80 (-) Transcript_108315:493-732(-)